MITNPNTAKAIETHYAGYRMRSRLEARWARFFDAMNFLWDYEPEGYELPSGRYLPDFWLPRVEMWAEAKPEPFNDRELRLARELVIATVRPLILLDGSPDTTNYWAMFPDETLPDGVSWMDLVWDQGRNYYFNENRFYTSTGAAGSDWRIRTQFELLNCGMDQCPYKFAVADARSERFGERQDWYASRPDKSIEEARPEVIKQKYGL